MSLSKAVELRQDKKRCFENAKTIYDLAGSEKRDLNSEEREQWDRHMADVDSLTERIEQIEGDEARMNAAREQLDQRDPRLTDPQDFDLPEVDTEEARERYNNAFKSYLTQGIVDISPEERATLHETRALAQQLVGTNAKGGFTVPTDFRAEVVATLKSFGGMREAAFTLNTANGQDLQVPVSDDTGNQATLIAEATAITSTTNVPFGQKTLEAGLYHTGPIKISMELLQDSAIDIEAFVRDAMITRFGRRWNNHFTLRSSTESTGPHGLVNDSTGAVIAADLAAVTFEKLMDLEATVDLEYRKGASWMFNDTARTGLRKLRELGTSGAFLWEASVQNGVPDRLLGYNVIINQDLASFGSSGNKPIWFGDYSHYWIRDVAQMSIRRLEERYAEEGVIALLGYARVDGRSVFGSTVPARKPYRCIIESTG